MTFPPGNSLHGLRNVIDNLGAATRPLSGEELQIALGERPSPQMAPSVQRGNRERARFALDALPREILADFLAEYLARRLGRAPAGNILTDAIRTVEAMK